MKQFLCILLAIQSIIFAYGQSAKNSISFDFVMQDIRDIVYAVSLAQGISIVCDDTVTGETSFRFTGSDFTMAAESFLRTNRLHAQVINEVIVLSKIYTKKSLVSDRFIEISAYDVSPSVLFNKLSEDLNIPITFETLPSVPVSLHVTDVKIEEAVSIVMQSFYGYAVTRNDKSIRITKNSTSLQSRESFAYQNGGNVSILEKDGVYSLDIQKGSFFESIEILFGSTNTQFCNLFANDRVISRLVFTSSDFESVLINLCSQVDAAFTQNENMYIIYGLEGTSNTLIDAGKYWETISLKYISSQEFVTLFSVRFPSVEIVVLSDDQIQLGISKKDASSINEFIRLCDAPKKPHIVQLEYITTDKFLSHLPPGISVEQFSDSGNGHTLFFTGSDESFSLLKESLKIVDCPSVIVGYDLLVLQVLKSESLNWKPKMSAEKVSLGDQTALSAHLGSVMALNVDVVSAFGYTFAAELQTALGENKAEVYVDTKLQGISGSPIHFQNTNTFRYQDTAIDPETGKPVYSGITREIVSGLVLNIEGWVSGDGMVTTKVTASLSTRGADVSENGNPPPTSEKIVTTEVRGKSGEPIILSGLVQNDSSFVEEKVPLLSKIPLLGWLFKSLQKSEESTEMIIYLVPHVEGLQKEYVYDF